MTIRKEDWWKYTFTISGAYAPALYRLIARLLLRIEHCSLQTEPSILSNIVIKYNALDLE